LSPASSAAQPHLRGKKQIRECEIRSPKTRFPNRITKAPPRSHNTPPTGTETGPPRFGNLPPHTQKEPGLDKADPAGFRCSPLISRPSSAAAAPFWRTKRLRRLHATAKLVALSPGLADAAIAGCLTSNPSRASKSPRGRLQLLRPRRWCATPRTRRSQLLRWLASLLSLARERGPRVSTPRPHALIKDPAVSTQIPRLKAHGNRLLEIAYPRLRWRRREGE
jgi:hypothetical protein